MRWSIAVVLLGGCSRYEPPGAGGDASADSAGDSPISACGPGYLSINGGQPGHSYKLVNATDSWVNQLTACSSFQSYLAIPNNTAELTAMFGAFLRDVWVGVNDTQNEGSFIDSLGNSFVGIAVTQNDAINDCVHATGPSTLEADDCSVVLPAVCECAP